MSARIPAGFGEIWMQFNHPSDPENMYTAIGVDTTGGVPIDSIFANQLLSTAHAQLQPMVSADLTLGPGHVISGQDGADIRYDGSAAAIAGTAAAGMSPNNTAWLLRKNTTMGGRRGRGRLYVPGVPDTSSNGIGLLTSPALSLAQTCATLLESALTGLAGIDNCVLFHETAPFTPTPIVTITAQPRVATQRRRMRP